MNRWLNALIKFIIFMVIVHVIIMIFGYFWGTSIAFFGLKAFWPHFNAVYSNIISIIGAIVIYFVIYGFFTDKKID